jgi:cell division septum initiation protein DivIVA
LLRLREPNGAETSTRRAAVDPEAPLDPPVEAEDGWPGEVRELLQKANGEVSALRAERRVLMARVADLEKSLRAVEANNRLLKSRMSEMQHARNEQAAAPPNPNNQWLAGVADRTAYALRSSQEMARGVVERARRRAREIEQVALQEAADIRKRAEVEAERILTVANYDAEGLLQGAQASSEELLSEAGRLRDRAMAQFAERRADRKSTRLNSSHNR